LFNSNNILESEIGTSVLYENNSGISHKTENIKHYKSFLNEILNYMDNFYKGSQVDLEGMLENEKDIFIKLCNIADDKIVNVTVD